MLDVLVIGAGPAGAMSALGAGELGPHPALVTQGEFGGMAANNGPDPVRTLAPAARLIGNTTRALIDGRPAGFCRLIVDRATRRIVGCHLVGERAAEIVRAAALAMAGNLSVEALARTPLSFPTCVGVLGPAAATAARQLNVESDWQARSPETAGQEM